MMGPPCSISASNACSCRFSATSASSCRRSSAASARASAASARAARRRGSSASAGSLMALAKGTSDERRLGKKSVRSMLWVACCLVEQAATAAGAGSLEAERKRGCGGSSVDVNGNCTAGGCSLAGGKTCATGSSQVMSAWTTAGGFSFVSMLMRGLFLTSLARRPKSNELRVSSRSSMNGEHAMMRQVLLLPPKLSANKRVSMESR
mmetsp:Transcript_46646/g.125261  ORF Transcript_46646/g.125261 Transcript_46646/m.125261 type:complete len:207 (-) Transcript_46646:256-876(-)